MEEGRIWKGEMNKSWRVAGRELVCKFMNRKMTTLHIQTGLNSEGANSESSIHGDVERISEPQISISISIPIGRSNESVDALWTTDSPSHLGCKNLKRIKTATLKQVGRLINE